MSDTNGQGKSRLDRIEEMIERQVLANEAAHEFFREEDKRLLTAQILMNGAMQKTVQSMEKMAGTVDKLAAGMASLQLEEYLRLMTYLKSTAAGRHDEQARHW